MSSRLQSQHRPHADFEVASDPPNPFAARQRSPNGRRLCTVGILDPEASQPRKGRWALSARLCPAQSGQVQLEHGPMGAMLPWSETGRL